MLDEDIVSLDLRGIVRDIIIYLRVDSVYMLFSIGG